ncbi:hypothetical protein [Sanguibacter sp. HDW7]|uniref:hypothetical protein n=1 Tax=Sanguibacter sp. HDW7 TaxID=2714931 RepID=UPI00140A105D|nr:hypothetical protein [Sanguibacter sp. HDW7]QIK83106.1 hypothetical protein G7063_05290 [Sanguibacter sp. HDW7]
MATAHRGAAQDRATASQDRAELRQALETELRGYVRRGLDDRADDVRASLRAHGFDVDDEGDGTETAGGADDEGDGTETAGRTDDEADDEPLGSTDETAPSDEPTPARTRRSGRASAAAADAQG